MGSGVGLDTPESVIALLDQLARDGWQLGDAAARPDSGLALMGLLQQGIANDPKNGRCALQARAIRCRPINSAWHSCPAIWPRP
jgi:cobalamin biosynthesis Mg chelatase CobN